MRIIVIWEFLAAYEKDIESISDVGAELGLVFLGFGKIFSRLIIVETFATFGDPLSKRG